MKKFLLTLGVATMALSSFASTRILYNQNFESVSSPADAGWGAYRGISSIASDDFGKFLELNQNGQNGGSTFVQWGQDIFFQDGESVLEDGTYDLHFEFAIKNSECNQYNSAITIFTNHTPGANQPFRNMWSPAGYWQNYVFDVSQVDDGTKDALLYAINGGTKVNETTAEDGTVTVSYSIDYSDPNTLTQGTWYVVDCHVDVNARTVEYEFTTLDGEIIKSGEITVPETNIADGSEISMYAEGMNVMLARNKTCYDIDNIRVSCETKADYANVPEVALTRLGKTADDELNLNMRAYTCKWLDGEVLNITGTDGTAITVDYSENNGEFVYETTTSGLLKVWTSCNAAVSEVVEVDVDCTPVILPEGTATVSAVSEGYAKTYTLTVDNSDVLLRPTIFIDYKFVGENGDVIEAEGQASGCTVSVDQAGTLTVTTAAFGYESNSVEVVNDLQFETKKTYDFARMSKEDITAALGVSEFTVLNSGSTSGFSNWTARKRLYYVLEGSEHEVTNEETGETSMVKDNVYPFGFIAEDNTTNVLEYAVLDRSADAEYDNDSYFEGLTIFPDKGKVDSGLPNIGMIYRIGLYNDQTKNNNNNVIIRGLDETDFVVVNYINDYGSNSCHPEVATDQEYYDVLAGSDAVYSVAKSGVLNEATNLFDVTHALYRIDTAITKITIYAQGGNGVEAIATEVAGDGYYYTIDGLRLAEPTQPGLYIHNGKKIIIK